MDGDKEKLIEIYDKYRGMMMSVARGILHDDGLAEDAVSDAFIAIIKNIHKINHVESNETKGYIVIVTRSRAINIYNKRKKHGEDYTEDYEKPDGGAPPPEIVAAKESRDKIVECIKGLPKALSDVLYLSAAMGYSNGKIADLLGLSNATVRKRLSRAKVKIKAKLAEEGLVNEEK